MDKQIVLEKYKSPEEKLIISKLFDKIDIVDKTNKVETTDFLNEVELNLVKKVLNYIKFENYVLFGGYDNSNRKAVVIYPEKMKEVFEDDGFKYDSLFSVIRVTNIDEKNTNYNHSVYLGGIIKLGIKREKIGDIIVGDTGADIIIKKETEKFLYANLKSLTRFKSADVSVVSVNNIENFEQVFENIKIITSSLRLDNIVSELAKTSRSKAVDILNEERVFVNYVNEMKGTKQVKEKDVITIRGKGKFILDEIAGNTKKGNYIIMVKKYA
ncbi:MAG: hypothetical protein IKE01_06370 [Clostridia bacterium]|nr:hypothetical protein [Clostridia bacterium]